MRAFVLQAPAMTAAWPRVPGYEVLGMLGKGAGARRRGCMDSFGEAVALLY
jgi:hypothetical protein